MKIVKNNEQEQNLDDQSFETRLLKFLGENAFIFPETQQEMKNFINTCEGTSLELPEALKDPLAILKRGIKNPNREIELNNEETKTIEDNLAQAAREGKEIPSHIQKKMEDKRKTIEDQD